MPETTAPGPDDVREETTDEMFRRARRNTDYRLRPLIIKLHELVATLDCWYLEPVFYSEPQPEKVSAEDFIAAVTPLDLKHDASATEKAVHYFRGMLEGGGHDDQHAGRFITHAWVIVEAYFALTGTNPTPPDPLTPDERAAVARGRTADPPKYASGAVSIPITDRDAILGLVGRLEQRLAEVEGERDEYKSAMVRIGTDYRIAIEDDEELESQLAAARATGPVPESILKDAGLVGRQLVTQSDSGRCGVGPWNSWEAAKRVACFVLSLSPSEAGRG